MACAGSRVTKLLGGSDRASAGGRLAPSSGDGGGHADNELLMELLTLLSRFDQDRVRLSEGKVDPGGVPAMLIVATIVNSLIAFVTARCSDTSVLPSRVLPRLAEMQPYTQVLGEENERISIATAANGPGTLGAGASVS